MDHGYSASVAYDLKINDLAMNETTINAAYASELGVPVGLIIGESGLEEQLFKKNDARSSLCFHQRISGTLCNQK